MICPRCSHKDFPKVPDYSDPTTWPKELSSVTILDRVKDELSGVEGITWREAWVCPNCSQRFLYTNSNI